MSSAFFDELRIQEPDFNLGVDVSGHAAQTAGVLDAIAPVIEKTEPHLVMVVGDVNSTLAAALAAAKLCVPIAHLEAGLRSGDRRMPEEINRLLTDQLAEICLTPSEDADENLLREGIPRDRIRFVGNIMIDTLLDALPRAHGLDAVRRFGLEAGGYVLATLHRPSNVDGKEQLAEILEALEDIGRTAPVLFPMHPRTKAKVAEFGLSTKRVVVVDPLGYLELLALQESAGLVMTDSGGIQEETTVLGVPCLTLRDTTERPVTITLGTNRLVPTRTRAAILEAFDSTWGTAATGSRPPLWDGRTAQRVREVLEVWSGHEPPPSRGAKTGG